MPSTLSNFQVLRPAHSLPQEQTLQWLAAAHARDGFEGASQLLRRIGLGPNKIAFRGISLEDCLHERWEEMEVYRGAGLGVRTAVFDRICMDKMEQFYPVGSPLPAHLMHVTCTGYMAPSPAQKVVAARRAQTVVTHLYHMGCYAAIPAIRVASGQGGLVDVVHTEVCSLHMNPALHEMEQLVIQSLFADGFIKYSVGEGGSGFHVLALQETLVPESADAMQWACDDWGFKMTLSREVPMVIAEALPLFVSDLLKMAGVKEDESLYFAIHPGGPKVIEQVALMLHLEPWQFAHSVSILRQCGNMSSATLPHVWAAMWKDELIKNGSKIVSLAYGPGLTIAGVVLECRR